MTRILDRIAKSFHGEFRPSSPDDYFALRLASRLGEPEAAAHFAILVSQYPQNKLLSAYEKTRATGQPEQRLGRIFHTYLESSQNGNGNGARPRLLSVRVERRTVAVALFAGTHLEGRRVLQLSSDPELAEASSAAFIRTMIAETDCTAVAIEPAPGGEDSLRAILHHTVVSVITSLGLSLWEISKKTLLNAFGYPPLKNRPDLRRVMLSIWPTPGIKTAHLCALDAFAVGLFVQTERLFNNF